MEACEGRSQADLGTTEGEIMLGDGSLASWVHSGDIGHKSVVQKSHLDQCNSLSPVRGKVIEKEKDISD